ncbi:DUF3141 domain-containing protein [Camelimonas fluminis]|uniref:DUF3141 domain-containing protein n=1 Tax=Camelimonas fluminis TaxID=1576911 RepID=A0ABV7UIG8_9HYPH|nr:DUF3141 domain-containing protein [Camelimonas fluminis]
MFASYGDNITPPHQALAWLKAVYKTTDALKEAGQRIVFMTDPRVGHLGIFVSASVARLEHRAILESLDDVVNLPPGLYEMKISNPTNDPDCRKPQYSVSFEERRVEDLAFDNPRKAFERVRQLSQANETLYSNFVSPWVQAMTTPWSAEVLRWLHPMRTSRYMLSEKFSPWMHVIARLADEVRAKRLPAAMDNPMRAAERTLSEQMQAAIEMARETRDSAQERAFRGLYDY